MKPNIILFMCDQLRSFAVGCYGNDFVQTPNIDRLAANGARFATAVTNNPVCTPARSITLTGQYSRTCTGMLGNVHDNPPNPKRDRLTDTTLPEALHREGYDTALIGKWHIDPQPQLEGFDRTVYPDFEHRYYDQQYWNENGESWTVREFGPDYELTQLQEYLDADRDRPFFVFYNIGQPHQPIGPRHMPERYCRMYDPQEVLLRPNVPDEFDPEFARHWYNIYTSAAYFWRYVAEVEQDPVDLVDDDFGIRDLTALYCGATTMVDDYVGKVMQALQGRGLADNTIVVFVSDHGDNLGSHGKFNKSQLIEEAIRVPLIIRDPRQPDGIVATDGVASLVDLMPTLLELAGVAIPDSVQGVSLAPVVRGEQTRMPPAAFIETGNRIGVRTATHLLGKLFDQEQRAASGAVDCLYDLEADPYELDNLAAAAAAADRRQELKDLLERWDARTSWLDAPPPVDVMEYMARSRWRQ